MKSIKKVFNVEHNLTADEFKNQKQVPVTEDYQSRYPEQVVKVTTFTVPDKQIVISTTEDSKEFMGAPTMMLAHRPLQEQSFLNMDDEMVQTFEFVISNGTDLPDYITALDLAQSKADDMFEADDTKLPLVTVIDYRWGNKPTTLSASLFSGEDENGIKIPLIGVLDGATTTLVADAQRGRDWVAGLLSSGLTLKFKLNEDHDHRYIVPRFDWSGGGFFNIYKLKAEYYQLLPKGFTFVGNYLKSATIKIKDEVTMKFDKLCNYNERNGMIMRNRMIFNGEVIEYKSNADFLNKAIELLAPYGKISRGQSNTIDWVDGYSDADLEYEIELYPKKDYINKDGRRVCIVRKNSRYIPVGWTGIDKKTYSNQFFMFHTNYGGFDWVPGGITRNIEELHYLSIYKYLAYTAIIDGNSFTFSRFNLKGEMQDRGWTGDHFIYNGKTLTFESLEDFEDKLKELTNKYFTYKNNTNIIFNDGYDMKDVEYRCTLIDSSKYNNTQMFLLEK